LAAVRNEEGVSAWRGRRGVTAAVVAAILACVTVAAVPAQPTAAASIYCSTVSEARQIVEVVHGFHSGAYTWHGPALAQLAAAGPSTCVDVFDYGTVSTNWVTDPKIGGALANRITLLAKASKLGHGSGKLIVVAHSMGGLAVRCAASPTCNGNHFGVSDDLAELISFDAPNRGSWLVGPGLHDVGRTVGSLLSAACSGWTRNIPNPVCETVQALGTSDATRAFKPDSDQLKALPQLPRSTTGGANIPVYGLAGQVEVYASFFGLHSMDVGDGGDLVVFEDSAIAAANKVGNLGGEQIINCGRIDVSLFLRSGRSCWHSTETNDTRFLQAAAHQIALVEAHTSARVVVPPCVTKSELVAALPPDKRAMVYPGDLNKAVNPLVCSGAWAASGIAFVWPGATFPDGTPLGNTETVIAHYTAGSWHVVDRQAPCAAGQIPGAIYKLACMSN
jgi:pimeloyl-ACP methyl ester carboxylesterase